ncbi:hypothetical protein WICMUC_000131 [Wickerhamomyces mucosus]|uniref:Uncharacterized protein n=1 Tax=Wickerhamomyces mucosus TaxID=1378264 RepID=A0A9P8TJC0_9ASCO|nr:hypothetical protein WICMUC_000131 [Wickerhamomyces mucosus]
MINPIPSNAKMAVPMKTENSDLLMINLHESLTPFSINSHDEKNRTIIKPANIKMLAKKDVKDNFETFLTNDNGMNNKHWKT